ncbi:hypothetical protein N7457_004913 [Penicillium paradoxum]|uniref:uncharacterized protein n=1 Tax=Penicillium paradoxum TaxID=176176 RepID=UPI0025477959|nr:uncharacterized protein N7457_004913 [Penicillium paradoxum]KAJ5783139.1 hypothetical protein N7457_004913 [Penicillium paradoxum]
MKLAVLTLAFAACAHGALSPRSQIPNCALDCMDHAVREQTSCGIDDFRCICMVSDVVQKAGKECVLQKCGVRTALSMILCILNEEFPS